VGRKHRWVVNFDKSCKYKIDLADQFDINKLCGIGFLPFHHGNSARFGWLNPQDPLYKDKIVLYAYCYVNGERKYEKISVIDCGVDTLVELYLEKDKYVFIVGDKTVEIPKIIDKTFGYKLNPYFGGNQVAPHTMKIKLKRL
jgi:hypothetical protein